MYRNSAEMQFFIVLLLLGSCVLVTRSRPTRLEEGNDSETAEAEYEGNDDTAADDYLREDQDPVAAEVQQKNERPENVQQESQEQGDARDFEVASDQQSAQNKYGYESVSDNNSGSRKERERHGITDLNNESEKDYLSDKASLRKSQEIDETGNVAPNEFYSRAHFNRPHNDLSIARRSGPTNPEYGEMLFKMKPAQTSRQQNNIAEEAGEQSNMFRQYYSNMHSKPKDQESENTLNYERDRRHAQNVEEKQNSDSTCTPIEKEEVTESSENAILRNLKKLSEQDLEELLNSLPDDKKALLKKIMDKREITKKAGAVDEDSFIEGGLSDTSKLEGGYSVDSNTDPTVTTDTSETSKQPENSENFSSKSSDNESGSRGSGSQSAMINNTDMKNNEPGIRKENENYNTDSKNDVNIRSEEEEISKNENKRETNNKDLKNENISLEDSNMSDYQSEGKNSNDILVNQEELCSENEDWIDTNPNEPEESNARSETYKREISQKDPLALQDCVKSLEESFPAVNSYDNNNSESEIAPLIRVKRTEKDHHVKKRDSSLLPNVNVHFSPGAESEYCENEEKSEFKDYGVFDPASNFVRDDQEFKSKKYTVSTNSNTGRRSSQFDLRDYELHPAILTESQKNDKNSLGTDTDSVLSGVEGVDDNIMYNSGSRGKRTLESSDDSADKINLKRGGRTAGPTNDDLSENSINVSQYQDDGAFGPLPSNSEDVGRFKRVRQVKQK